MIRYYAQAFLERFRDQMSKWKGGKMIFDGFKQKTRVFKCVKCGDFRYTVKCSLPEIQEASILFELKELRVTSYIARFL